MSELKGTTLGRTIFDDIYDLELAQAKLADEKKAEERKARIARNREVEAARGVKIPLKGNRHQRRGQKVAIKRLARQIRKAQAVA